MIGIYGVEDTFTGNIYVGQSTDIAKRWSNHSAFLKNNEHRYTELQEAYNLNQDRIKYTILEECSKNELQEREDWWIKHIQKIDGWTLINKQKFGGKHNTKVKDTSKMKIAQRGQKNGNARLRKEDVINIKKYLEEGIAQKKIAKKYNVSQTHISNIALEKRWENV